MNATLRRTSSTKQHRAWKKADYVGSTKNELVEAYLKGKKDAIEERDKIYHAAFLKNLDSVTNVTTEILSFFKERNLQHYNTYLRVQSASSFHILFVIPNEVFIEDSFLSIYTYVSNLEEKYEDDTFCFEASFCPTTSEENLNHYNLIVEGYLLKFNQK